MMDIIFGIVLVGLLILFVYHLCTLGSIYIEFDGRQYWVWQRAFLGYNNCHGLYYTEEGAKECVENLKKNPPRNIEA